MAGSTQPIEHDGEILFGDRRIGTKGGLRLSRCNPRLGGPSGAVGIVGVCGDIGKAGGALHHRRTGVTVQHGHRHGPGGGIIGGESGGRGPCKNPCFLGPGHLALGPVAVDVLEGSTASHSPGGEAQGKRQPKRKEKREKSVFHLESPFTQNATL